MKNMLYLLLIVLLFTACGSDNDDDTGKIRFYEYTTTKGKEITQIELPLSDNSYSFEIKGGDEIYTYEVANKALVAVMHRLEGTSVVLTVSPLQVGSTHIMVTDKTGLTGKLPVHVTEN